MRKTCKEHENLNEKKGFLAQVEKIFVVIKVLFGTAAKKYPVFFVAQVIKTILQIAQPFIAVFISPLIVEEIVGDRDLKKLITYAAILILSEAILQLLVDRCGTVINKHQERLDNYFNILII